MTDHELALVLVFVIEPNTLEAAIVVKCPSTEHVQKKLFTDGAFRHVF